MRRISPTAFRIARRGTSREINRQIALNLIREGQPISRAELARKMGLRRGAVTRLVDELLEAGIVFEGAKGESRRGRKPRHLHIETRRRCAVAVDVSASGTEIMVTDLLGQPVGDVVELQPRRARHLVKDLVRHIKAALEDNPDIGECIGIGVAVAGLVDLEGGLTYAPTLAWRDAELRGRLTRATGLPVVVENSVKACVLGQVWAVRGDPPVDGPVAFVDVSDGVGVGIAVDGKLMRGSHNVAGEFGHVPLNMYGPRCSCGQKGCLEAYVSKRAVIARYRGTDPSWPESGRVTSINIEHIMAQARLGETQAVDTLSETGSFLGRGFAAIIKSIDPRRIYVGGEITEVWDLVYPAVRQTLQADAIVSGSCETEILPVSLGEHPRLRGAAALITVPAFAAAQVS